MRLNNKLYENQGVHVISSIFTVEDGKTKVLLIKRKNDPYKDMWALVGGALYNNETLDNGVKREIEEKSGLKNVSLHQFGVYDELGLTNEINMRMISIGYLAVVDSKKAEIVKENRTTLDAEWFDIDNIPKLAFKHNEILAGALTKLKELIVQTNILKSLLPSEFTMPELQKIFEGILNKEFDRRNFRKKIISLGVVEDTNKEVNLNGKRPAKLYRFKNKIEVKKVF